MERRLVAIMAADVVGFSTRMEQSEAETVRQLAALTDLIRERIARHGGRLFSRAGDGFLCEFPSTVNAVQAGFEIQRALRAGGKDSADGLQLRMGIHLADAVVDGDDLLGDGVNIAARVEALADPGSVTITQPVFDQVKRTAKLAFESIGGHTLKNISEPVQLYRIVGELGDHSYLTGLPGALPAETGRDKRPVNPHSLVVLPFANLSDDPGQEYFSDGFSEDLITELSRFHQIFVLSRNASFALKGRRLDPRELGRQLGTSYCLEGSVRNLSSRVRITCALIDTRSGDQVWAEKYDCKLEELFDVQDDLAASIVSMVAGRIEREARVAAKCKKPSDMLAYDCLMRGLEHHRLGGVTRETAEQAVHWFEMAIEKDPSLARAYAWRACARSNLAEWTGEDVWDQAFASARRGVEIDDDDAECHRILGAVSLYKRNYDQAEYHFRRALDLNPNHAYVVGRMGELYNFLGDGETALKYQLRARQLDPFLPAYCRELEAVAYYVLGRFAETVAAVGQLSPTTRRGAAYRVAAYNHLANEDARKEAVNDLKVIDPNFTVTGFLANEFYKDRRLRQQLRDDLEHAGLK